MPAIGVNAFNVPGFLQAQATVGVCHQFTVKMINYLFNTHGIALAIPNLALPYAAITQQIAYNHLLNNAGTFTRIQGAPLALAPGQIVLFGNFILNLANNILPLAQQPPFALSHSMICVNGAPGNHYALMGVNNGNTFGIPAPYYQEIQSTVIIGTGRWGMTGAGLWATNAGTVMILAG